MSVSINMKELLEAGVHYGHQTRRWNPRMSQYIFGSRNGIHIIDLQKTVKMFQKACDFLEDVSSKGGHVLFVGTKRLSRDLVKEESERSGSYFINYRWLGGTLTNFQTIRQSIHRLRKIDRMSQDGTFQKLTKKEALGLSREKDKLEQNIGGIRDMPGLPSAIFVVDAHKETIAIQEAKRLNIPVVAITDTNADPTIVDYAIPGNDDSIKALKLFISTAADACLAGKARSKDTVDEGDGKKITAGTFRDDKGNKVNVETK
ncbi:MAG: 30S ribosomal protein S2 [Pseudobacteriovorax sp.]|nr:30S ribosomal protein S2 [Pseudobacteriovorax sp.]